MTIKRSPKSDSAELDNCNTDLNTPKNEEIMMVDDPSVQVRL